MKQTKLKRLIFTGVQDFLPLLLKWLYPIKARREKKWVDIPEEPGIYRWRDLMKGATERNEDEPVDTDEVALFQYTGGTTGVAKGVMLTHRNLVANAYQVRLWIPQAVEGQEKALAVLPFFHVYGMTTAMNLPVLMAAEMILVPRFEVKQILHIIHKERPTIFPGVPTMYQAINMMEGVEKFDLSSVKYCISGAAPLPLQVMKRFTSLTGAKLVEGYGLTEASPVTHANPLEGVLKEGSIGIPFPDTDSKITDLETGEDLPVGQTGELCVKGPQVMKGYWKMPEETKQVLTEDGWLKTGDIARMDEEGYFYIVDRKKDMIIAGGYNIYPRDIDEVLFAHPKIQDAVTVGVPDPYRGETVKAFVVLKPGETATEEEIIAYCRERLARYKVPKLVEFRESLPKSLVGKVLRKVLREEEIKKYEQQMKAKENDNVS
jgi:long-chain acyl-CoA synthetase